MCDIVISNVPDRCFVTLDSDLLLRTTTTELNSTNQRQLLQPLGKLFDVLSISLAEASKRTCLSNALTPHSALEQLLVGLQYGSQTLDSRLSLPWQLLKQKDARVRSTAAVLFLFGCYVLSRML